ncbi:MAG: MarR family transcriptional regulator [Pseudomonadota bacterium]
MEEDYALAHELDRVMRKLDAKLHRLMPSVDKGRVGPMGGLLLLQLETMQPCNIQALATAMGRDNSQLTRLIRDLEAKGVIKRSPQPDDARATLVSLTPQGMAFLTEAKTVLAQVVNEVSEHLTASEVADLIGLLRKL